MSFLKRNYFLPQHFEKIAFACVAMCAFDIITFELTSNHGPHLFANNEFSDEKLPVHKVIVKWMRKGE